MANTGKSKVISSGKGIKINAGGTGKMNTSPLPGKGGSASVPNWNQSVSPKNNFMKAKAK